MKDEKGEETGDREKERGKGFRLTGWSLRPCVLVRFLSIRRPAAAKRDLYT